MLKEFDIHGYKTPANAKNAADMRLTNADLTEDVRYVIAVTKGGRYCFVAVHYPTHLVGWLLHNNFCVV